MLKILIMEDEKPALALLEKMLAQTINNFTIIGRCDSIESSVTFLKKHQDIDLIFMDIHLGDGNSFDIFLQIQIDTPIIFTTAFDMYAIKAFELNSIDYLLKPIKKEDLTRSIEKFYKSKKHLQQFDIQYLSSIISNRSNIYKERFLVYIGNNIKAIMTSDIAYFYSLDSATYLVTHNGNTYDVNMSLEQLIGVLDPQIFFRVNRQYIVAFSAIDKIQLLSTNRIKIVLLPPTDKEILVSSNKNQLFKEWLNR